MADTKTEKKPTPDSTKRFRLALAALRNIEDASDNEVHTSIDEFRTFSELYIAAKMREVDARAILAPQIPRYVDAVTPLAGRSADTEAASKGLVGHDTSKAFDAQGRAISQK